MDDDSKKPLFDRKAPPVDLMSRTKQEKDEDIQALASMVVEARKEMTEHCRHQHRQFQEDSTKDLNEHIMSSRRLFRSFIEMFKGEQESAEAEMSAVLRWVQGLSPEGEFPKKMGDQFKRALDIEKARNMVWLVVLSLSLCLGAFAGTVKVGTMYNERAAQQGLAMNFMMEQLNNLGMSLKYKSEKTWIYYDVKATTKKDYKEGRVILYRPKGR